MNKSVNKAVTKLKQMDVKDIPSLSEIYIQTHQHKGKLFIPNVKHTHQKNTLKHSQTNVNTKIGASLPQISPTRSKQSQFDVPLFDFDMDFGQLAIDQLNQIIKNEGVNIKQEQEKFQKLRNQLRVTILELRAQRMTLDGIDKQLIKIEEKVDVVEKDMEILIEEYLPEQDEIQEPSSDSVVKRQQLAQEEQKIIKQEKQNKIISELKKKHRQQHKTKRRKSTSPQE